MSATDSVSIFAEGTFEEQTREILNYLVRNRPEEEAATFVQPFEDLLKVDGGQNDKDDEERRRKIFGMVLKQVKGLGEGSEREIEGFFNLIYAHLFSLYALDSEELQQILDSLLQTIISSPTQFPDVKYQILSHLFNSVLRKSPLRLRVYRALLQLAVSEDKMNVLQPSVKDVQRWLNEWEISQEDKSLFLKDLVNAFAKSDRFETLYQYQLIYVGSLPPSSPLYRDAGIDVVATALRLPSIFDFDPLFKLDAVLAAKDHALFELLRIFWNDGLDEYRTWHASHSDLLGQYNLDNAQLERKIRLLSLAALGFKNIGRDLSYSTIASALEVDISEVETWVIDVIRVGLLSGKLSQMTQTLHVVRSTSRTFERPQWEALEKRMVAWKAGLASVLEVVSSARRRGAVEITSQPAHESNGIETANPQVQSVAV